MATDIKLSFDTFLEGDMEYSSGDLTRDKGLDTAVLVSLFTDRRAEDSDQVDNGDKKGWWGDLIPVVDDDKIGSRLWLLYRAKDIPQTQTKAKQYIQEALQWLIDDESAAKINVTTEVVGDVNNKRLYCTIEIYKIDNTKEVYKFDDLWNYTSIIGVM